MILTQAGFLGPGDPQIYAETASMTTNCDPSQSHDHDAGHRHVRPGAPIVVESNTTLSASVIWKWQQSWFEHASPCVWTNDVVPHHINTNSFCALRYARIAAAWMHELDMRPTGRWIAGQTPLTVIEFGAGNGLFAHRFIRAFRSCVGASSRLRYVLSDISDARLAALATLAPLQAALRTGELELRRHTIGGVDPIPVQGLDGLPLLAIANYVFDGLAADAFELCGGQAFRALPRVSLPADAQAVADPMAHFVLDWDRRPLEPADLEVCGLLDRYLVSGAQGCALVPRGAFECLQDCVDTGCAQLLLLAADRGTAPDHPLSSWPLTVARHGSFSIDVNFDAITRWFEAHNGAAISTRSPRSAHVNFLGLLGASLDACPLLRAAWVQGLEELGVDDYLAIKNAAIAHPPDDLWALLSLLRFSGHDERLFLHLLRSLVGAVLDCEDTATRAAVATAVTEIHANALPDPRGQLEFGVAQIRAALGDWEAAVEGCRASLLCEPDENVESFLALCQSAIATRPVSRQLQLFS